MGLTLEIRSGRAAGRTVSVDSGHSVTVGRTSRADALFPEDSSMSGLHFVVVCDAGGCTLRDLRSSNGTFLNGARVDSAVLRHGDTVVAGNTSFVVHLTAEDAAVTLTQPVAAPLAVTPQTRLLALLRNEFQPLYAILDAAVEPDVLKVMYESKAECESLFEGAQGAQLVHFSPHLVRLPTESPLLQTLATKALGKNWGVYLTCPSDLASLRAHLRQFLMLQLPDGKPTYFRFYDPRVLRVYLPTCNPDETNHFFGPVKYYLMEDEKTDKLLLFANTGQGVEKKALGLLQPAAPENKPLPPSRDAQQ